jgi:hypothetical protein
MGGIISGILGGGSSPGQEAQMEGLKQSRAGIQRYRPEIMQAHLNLLSNASKAYQPMNNALETMYGGRGPKPSQPAPGPQGGPPAGGAAPNQPPRFMGHDVPPQGQPTGGPYDQIYNFLDPAGIFKGFF